MEFPLTPRYFFAIQNLNYNLAELLKTGLALAPDQVRIGLSRLENYTAAAVLQHLDRLGFGTGYIFKEPKKKDVAISETARVYEQYVKFLKSHNIHAVSSSVPIDYRNLSTEENHRIRAEHGAREMPISTIDVNDPVAVAWQIARENSERARQRLGALLYLTSQLPRGGVSTMEREYLENDNQAIMTYLNSQARSFGHDEMMFAIVLGGEALELTRRSIFAEDLSERYSVIHYLQPDRIPPGRYMSSVEDGFRAKLQAYRDNR